MLHAGLDLSRKKLDVCLLSRDGAHLDQLAVPPDVDSLRTLAMRIEEVHGEPVCAVIESMTGARIVHDTLEACGWSVEIADAQKVKGLAPLACKTDKIDSMVLAVLSHRDLVPAIGFPIHGSGRSASSRASGCTSSSTSRRSSAASTRR
jgi:transposase